MLIQLIITRIEKQVATKFPIPLTDHGYSFKSDTQQSSEESHSE